MRAGMLLAATGTVAVDRGRWSRPVARSIVADIDPQMAGFRSTGSRRQDRNRRIVAMQFGGAHHLALDRLDQGTQQPNRMPDLVVRQGGAAQRDAAAGEDL